MPHSRNYDKTDNGQIHHREYVINERGFFGPKRQSYRKQQRNTQGEKIWKLCNVVHMHGHVLVKEFGHPVSDQRVQIREQAFNNTGGT